jgi:hypothetical protein
MSSERTFEGGPRLGDRVKLSAASFAKNADMTLQGRIGKVVQVEEDGRVSIRFDGGRFLVGRSADAFDFVSGARE